jgi:hypothetical protein
VIVLLDTSHDLDVAAAELACATGQLVTPLAGFRLRDDSRPWAIDNGAFAGFDEKAYLARLRRQEGFRRDTCLFVTAPDVVGEAMRTLECFEQWKDRLEGWPLAFVCQDGQQNVRIPWPDIAAIFIGGTDNFKGSAHSFACIKTAKALGKWVHVGRVNTPGRFEFFAELGVDSIDGTGISRYTHMREAIGQRDNQEKLWATSSS